MSVSGTSLSKEKLKNELIAHKVPLPPARAKKEAFVQLYDKHVVNNQGQGQGHGHGQSQSAVVGGRTEFSSDEDDSPTSPKSRSIHTSVDQENLKEFIVNGVNISQLSDDELHERLIELDKSVGPVVATTRSVYERKLVRLINGNMGGDDWQNGLDDQANDYSDSDVELDYAAGSSTSTTNQHTTTQSQLRQRASKEDNLVPKNKAAQGNDSSIATSYIFQDSPMARRSIRPNITFTPMSDTRKQKYFSSTNSSNVTYMSYGKNDNDPLSNLASRVVEQIAEPSPANQSRVSTVGIAVAVVVAVILVLFLVYQQMEGSGNDDIQELSNSNI